MQEALLIIKSDVFIVTKVLEANGRGYWETSDEISKIHQEELGAGCNHQPN